MLDESSGGVFYTDAQIYDAANQAQLEAQVESRYQGTSTGIVLSSGVDLIAIGTGVWIPQVILMTSTDTSETIQQYFATSHTKLEQYSRYWRNEAAGQPKWFVLWDYDHLRAWPTPNAAYTMTLVGIPWPTEVASGAEDISVPQLAKQAIAYRAAGILLEHTFPTAADTYNSLSQEVGNQFSIQLRNRGGRINRLRPGTSFTRAQQGSIEIGKRLT